jgi:hypothetical protein
LSVHIDIWAPAILHGEQFVVVPAGTEVYVRSTVPEKPPVIWSRIVEEAGWPAVNQTLVGSATREKSGGGFTVTSIATVWVRLPLVPVIVTVYDRAAEEVRVQVDVWVPLMLDGEHVVVTPDGLEELESPTVPLNPPVDVRAIVEVVDPFATKDTRLGEAASEKSAGAVTVAAIVASWCRLPLVPVIVTVYVPGLEPVIVHVEV